MTQMELVEAMLQKYPRTRSSDSDLIIGILQAKGANLSPAQREIMRSINFESIRRNRQLLQADGKYPADKEVQDTRRHKAELVRDTTGAHQDSLTVNLIKAPMPSWLEGLPGIL